MKSIFRIFKNRSKKIAVTLTRDSVSLGDDYDAPHEVKTQLHCVPEPLAFVNAAALGYLPSVAGERYKWVCTLNGKKIVEIRASGARALVADMALTRKNSVHFIYHAVAR
jgi:hypothetical protein